MSCQVDVQAFWSSVTQTCYGRTTAVTEPPPTNSDFKTRVIGGSGSTHWYAANARSMISRCFRSFVKPSFERRLAFTRRLPREEIFHTDVFIQRWPGNPPTIPGQSPMASDSPLPGLPLKDSLASSPSGRISLRFVEPHAATPVTVRTRMLGGVGDAVRNGRADPIIRGRVDAFGHERRPLPQRSKCNRIQFDNERRTETAENDMAEIRWLPRRNVLGHL